MRISSLELSGFKSFHRKTKIGFHPGSNGIVGPNGCGKSNVIDAVRWVAGEQNPRMLRANAMEDLISDGTVALKPVGMAEVTMVLAGLPGNGFDDVSITRRYYRDGESEYSINGVACRLKDIVDIFLDTGAGARSHSIIGQGEVESFIMAKPEEKRRLIEEVAGIVKYKTRRKEAWSRLKQTEENLVRIRDMSKDARKRRENLKRQAEQAEKLNALSDRAAGLELLMLGARKAESEKKMLESAQKKSALDVSVREIESERSGIANRLKNLEDEVQTLDETVLSADSAILAAKEKITAAVSSRELSARRMSDIEEIVSRLESDKLSLEKQARDMRAQILQTRSETESARGRIAAKRAELESGEKELESLRDATRLDREGMEDIGNRFFGAVEQCDSTEAAYRKLTGELERLSARSVYLSERKEALVAEKEKLSSQREKFLSQFELISGAQADSEKQRKELEEGLRSFGGEHKKLLADINSLKERRSECVSRLEALRGIQRSFEWLPESSRQFLLGKTGGILGVLSDYVSVPPEYSKAFEAALGERLGWIVVGTGGDVSEAIATLRRGETGRATFVPADSVPARKTRKTFPAPKGARPVGELVRVHGEGAAVLDGILEGVFVVDTLKDAFDCAAVSHGLCFATMEGDFLDSSGAVSGGWTTGGVFQRKSEIEKLGSEIAKLDRKIKSSLERAEGFEVRVEDLRSKMDVLNESIQADRAKLGSLERDLEDFNFAFEGKQSGLERLEAEAAETSESFEEKTRQAGQCEKKLDELRGERDGLRKRLSEFEEKTGDFERRENTVADRIGALKIDIASLRHNSDNASRAAEGLVRGEEEISARIREISAEIVCKAEEKKGMRASSEEAGIEIEGLEAALGEKRENLEKIRENRGAVFSDMRGLRDRIAELDSRIETARTKRGDFEISLKTMENNMEYLSGEIAEIIEKSGRKMPGTEEIEAADHEETKAALGNLKEKIDRFGLVNLLAPEEYEEAEKEYDFLENQMDDLEKSAASIKKSISRLDRESAEKFTEAFGEVDSKFRELLPALFKGGEGKLVMTDPGDPIETGIDIVVKPGGKKFQNMSLLSGGEKALSAIAFIISSCLVRPLPFIILDEIDAPLDDSNTGRFVSLIKDISRNSQTLVVTHNKATIANVDALIGITASKAANSAVVSVDLAKAV